MDETNIEIDSNVEVQMRKNESGQSSNVKSRKTSSFTAATEWLGDRGRRLQRMLSPRLEEEEDETPIVSAAPLQPDHPDIDSTDGAGFMNRVQRHPKLDQKNDDQNVDDDDKESSDTDSNKDYWSTDSSSSSDDNDEYYYQRARAKYRFSVSPSSFDPDSSSPSSSEGDEDSEDSLSVVEELDRKKFEDKPQTVKDDILHTSWIGTIKHDIKCDDCKKPIEGSWYKSVKDGFEDCKTCAKRNDFCYDCAEKKRWKNAGCWHDLKNVIEDDTELMRAIRLQEYELSASILQKCDIETLNKKDISGFSALFLSILYLPRLLMEFIKKGAKLNITDSHGRTPLMMACIKRNPEMAKLLMENCDKVTLNMKDNKDCTALVHAIQHLPDLIPAFIRKGALLHTVDKEKRTPLMLACRKNEEVAKTLLMAQKGKDFLLTKENIDHTCQLIGQGNINALRFAIDNKMEEVAKIMLIERDAEFDNKIGQSTLLVRALETKLPDVAKTILQKVKRQLKDDKMKWKKELLINYVNEPTKTNQTALSLASKHNYPACIKLILECGGDLYYEQMERKDQEIARDVDGNIMLNNFNEEDKKKVETQKKVVPLSPEDYNNFLDDQIRIDKNDSENIIFDYTKLITSEHNRELKLIEDLTNISPGHNYLIKHPLLEAIIISKWKRIELIWIIYMLLKLSFMGIFITLGVGTLGLQQFSCNVTELGTTKGINSRYIFVTLNTNSINYRSCSISR